MVKVQDFILIYRRFLCGFC